MKTVKKFTDTLVRNLKPTGSRYDVTEGNGFCMRISAKGKKSWVYVYWFDSKSKRMAIGYYPSISVAAARKLVADAILLKDKGIDPVQHKKDIEEAIKQEEAKELQTVEWLANEFYTRYILKNRKVPSQIKQHIDADIIPSIGSINLEEITTREITIALDKIVDRGANVHANKVLSTIKQMFTYAVSKGITERNPALLIKSKNIGGEEKGRDRFLTMEEIKIIWQWFSNKGNHRLHPATVLALKVLLLTGLRSNEVRLAEWSDISFDGALWIIPKEKYKTGIEHKVFLTEFTLQHLQKLKELSGCKWVLPSIADSFRMVDGRKIKIPRGSEPLSDKALARAVKRIEGRITDNEGNVLIEAPWTPHDLRRSFRTHIGKLGILPFISEKCLGHKPSKIEATYDKNEYLPERQAALELWSDTIKALVNNSNVVILDSARGSR